MTIHSFCLDFSFISVLSTDGEIEFRDESEISMLKGCNIKFISPLLDTNPIKGNKNIITAPFILLLNRLRLTVFDASPLLGEFSLNNLILN